MDAKKCDRCKEYYDEYEGVYKRGETGTIVQRYRIPYNRVLMDNAGYSTVPPKIFDLCPDCMRAFDKWMENECKLIKE